MSVFRELIKTRRDLLLQFCGILWAYTRYPMHRKNIESGPPKKFLSGKTQGIWKLCHNTGKSQGIWFAQFGNSLILKVKNISIFAAKISIKVGEVSSVYVIATNHVIWHRENLRSDRKITGNLKCNLSGYPE